MVQKAASALRAATFPLVLLIFPTVSVSGWFGPQDYDECILEHMTGVTSSQAVSLIRSSCRRASQSKSWFGPSDYDKCILENMKGITSDDAASLVRSSCRRKSQ
jgi:hypothetical protein